MAAASSVLAGRAGELQFPAGTAPARFRHESPVPSPARGRGGTMKREGGAPVLERPRAGECSRGVPGPGLAPSVRAVEQGARCLGPREGFGPGGRGSGAPAFPSSVRSSVSWGVARSSPPFSSLFALSSSVYGSPPGAQHCHRRRETAESETLALLCSSRGGFLSLAPLGTSCPSSLPAVPCSVLITIPGLHPPDTSSLPRPRCDNQKCLQIGRAHV